MSSLLGNPGEFAQLLIDYGRITSNIWRTNAVFVF